MKINANKTNTTIKATTAVDPLAGESLNDIFANLILNLFPKNIIQSCFSRVSGTCNGYYIN